MGIIQVAYTNSNCSDLWNVFKKQIDKHSDIPLYMISDTPINDIAVSNQYIYNNNDSYYSVWNEALKSFNSEYFIYLQEDFFLYSNINKEKINEYLAFLKTNPEYSFVRLIKSGNLDSVKITDTLFEIDSNNENSFAMQATIWRTSDYIMLMDLVKENKWLEIPKYRDIMMNYNIKGLYHYNGEPKRGLNHTDTSVYPYIATALVKGKWNISEYPNELTPILNENNIDINIRGTI